MSSNEAAANPPKFKRSAKNYLLDAPFQLKYTSYIVGLTLALSVALGVLLFRQSSKTVQIGNEAVRVGDESVKVGNDATEAGKEAVDQSKSLNIIFETNSGIIPASCTAEDTMDQCSKKLYGDNPTLLEMIKSGNDEKQKQIEDRAKALEDAATKLSGTASKIAAQRQALDEQRTTLMITVTGVLALLVLLVGFGGIIVTHKIVGPIYKMKRLLREVGDGKLTVSGSLRKGDELHDFFHVFELMVEKLRTRQKAEIERLDAAIEMAQRSGADEASIMKLQTLRTDMQQQLDT